MVINIPIGFAVAQIKEKKTKKEDIGSGVTLTSYIEKTEKVARWFAGILSFGLTELLNHYEKTNFYSKKDKPLGKTVEEATKNAGKEAAQYQADNKFEDAIDWYNAAYSISKNESYLDKISECKAQAALFQKKEEERRAQAALRQKKIEEERKALQSDKFKLEGFEFFDGAMRSMKNGNAETAIESLTNATDKFIAAYKLNKFEISTSITEVIQALIQLEALDEAQSIINEVKQIIPERMELLKLLEKSIEDPALSPDNLQHYFDTICENAVCVQHICSPVA